MTSTPLKPLRIAINGCLGRMGRAIAEASCDVEGVQVGSVLVDGSENPPHQNYTLSNQTLKTQTLHQSMASLWDVLIDFTQPQATLKALDFCQNEAKGLVIGTTGFDTKGLELIQQASKTIPIVFSPNMSVGVNVLFHLVEQAAKALDKEAFDAEIFEIHHRYKKDSPSGTALKIGEIIAKARGDDFQKSACFARQRDNNTRPKGEIGFSVARAGGVIGDHSAIFASLGERLEITHRSQSRQTYAHGSLLAAQFCFEKLKNNQPGLFSMNDVLGLHSNLSIKR